MNPPTGLGAGLGQGLQEGPAVGVIGEDRVSMRAAGHDEIDGSGKLDAQWSSHSGGQCGRAGPHGQAA